MAASSTASHPLNENSFDPTGVTSFFIVLFSLSFFLSAYILFCKFSIVGFFKCGILEDVLKREAAPKCVSAIQGFISTGVGVTIMLHCGDDIMYKRHLLTNRYAWFLWTYFYYDFVVMMFTCAQRTPLMKNSCITRKFLHCVKTNPDITFHHLVLPTVLLPTVVYFRRGIGDYFVGVFYAAELMSPFVNFHYILELLHMKKSRLYVINGFATIVVFFIIRICLFPYLYWIYAVYKDIPFLSVPGAIPLHCNVGTALPLGLMLYWLYCMTRGAMDHFRSRDKTEEESKAD